MRWRRRARQQAPPSGACWPGGCGLGGRRCSADRSRRAGKVRGGRASADACSVPRPPTSRSPNRVCVPADGVYAGWYERPERPSCTPARSTWGDDRRSTSTPTIRCSRRTYSTSMVTCTAKWPKGALRRFPAIRAQVRRHRGADRAAQVRRRECAHAAHRRRFLTPWRSGRPTLRSVASAAPVRRAR